MKEMGSFFERFRERGREARQKKELFKKIKSQREEIDRMVLEIFADPKVSKIRIPKTLSG
jgi:hypothetical protein